MAVPPTSIGGERNEIDPSGPSTHAGLRDDSLRHCGLCRPPREAPVRAAPLALLFAAALCVVLLFGVPFPPATAMERESMMSQIVGALLSTASAIGAALWPRAARAVAALLAV